MLHSVRRILTHKVKLLSVSLCLQCIFKQQNVNFIQYLVVRVSSSEYKHFMKLYSVNRIIEVEVCSL